MLDGVLDQLCQHHHERHRQLGGEHPEPVTVAHRHRRLPCGDVDHRGKQPGDGLVHVDLFVDAAREQLVHGRDGCHSSDSLDECRSRFLVGRATCLQTQKCGHRLQVVLDPVMNFPDRGVLADQCEVSTLDLGDVADQHHGTGTHTARTQRHRPQQHGRPARVGFHTHADVGVRPLRRRDDARGDVDHGRGVVRLERVGQQRRRDLRQSSPRELRRPPHAMKRRQRIGTRIEDDAALVDPHETVARAWGRQASRVDLEPRERAVGDHLAQVVRRVLIGQFER